MNVLLWSVVAALVLLLAISVAMRQVVAGSRGRRLEPEVGEGRIPLTPLQRRALGGLALGLALALSVLGLLTVAGPQAYHNDLGVRLLFYALMIGGLMGYLLLMASTRRAIRRGKLIIDERDQIILARAPAAQAVAVLGTVVVWTIALTEAYSGQGQIPIVFPTLIFWSSLVVYVVAYPIGILLGYWTAT